VKNRGDLLAKHVAETWCAVSASSMRASTSGAAAARFALMRAKQAEEIVDKRFPYRYGWARASNACRSATSKAIVVL